MPEADMPVTPGRADAVEPRVEFSAPAVFISSEQVVTPETARDRKKTLVRAAGESTVVLSQGDSEVNFFDSSGDKIGMQGRLTSADWGGYREAESIGADEDIIIATEM